MTEYTSIPGYCLNLIRGIARKYDTPVPLSEFLIVDTFHVSMLEFKPCENFPYLKGIVVDFRYVPKEIIHQNNEIIVDEDDETVKGIYLNGYNISGLRTLDSPCTIRNAPDFESESYLHMIVKGSEIKPLINALNTKNDYQLCYYRDEDNSVFALIDDTNKKVICSCPIGECGSMISAIYPIDYMKAVKPIMPNGDIELIIGNDSPIAFRWKDNAGNQYTYGVAPRVTDEGWFGKYKDKFTFEVKKVG